MKATNHFCHYHQPFLSTLPFLVAIFCADGAQVPIWAEKGVNSRAGGYIFPFQAGLAANSRAELYCRTFQAGMAAESRAGS